VCARPGVRRKSGDTSAVCTYDCSPTRRQQGGWTKSDAAFMASLATLAASVALTFLRIRRTAAASGSGVPTQSDTSQRVSVNGAAQGAKRQLWTLTLMGADAVHNESLPGACRTPSLATHHVHRRSCRC